VAFEPVEEPLELPRVLVVCHAAPRQRRSRRVVEVSSADFTIAVVGKTIDGVPIREELFVSKSG
jgi:hypothetical protein